MTNFKRIIIAVLTVLAISVPAEAQFRWGIKAGVDINSLSFSKNALGDVIDSSNRTGFTGGLTAEFTIPIIGLAFDASAMYTHKVNETSGATEPKTVGNDYISIPINLKYKFSLPVVSSFVVPYVFTGPNFSFLVSKKSAEEFFKNKSSDVSWNVGAGLQLLSHLQIGASYGFGINKAIEIVTPGSNTPVATARTNCWTVTAAWFF